MSLRVSSAIFLPLRFTQVVQTEKWKVEYLHQVTLSQKPFKATASCAWVHFADTLCLDETWCKVKKTMRKELIQPAARSTDPAVGGQQAASSGRHQATGHMFATSQDRAASRSTKFDCVGCRTRHLDQLESKIFLFWEEYSPLERITIDLPFERK